MNELMLGHVSRPGGIISSCILRCFRLVTTSTQTTRMPTQITITVATTGTIRFRSSHSGRPGNLDPSPPPSGSPFVLVPKGGAIVPGKRVRG